MTKKLLLLGVFHMRYTQDVFRYEMGDLNNDARQQEIKKITEKLKKFRPTKVAAEVVKSDQRKLTQAYHTYKQDRSTPLKIDETEQIGFRLAADLNLDTLYAVDWMDTVGNRGIGDVYQWAENNDAELLAKIKNYWSHEQPDKQKTILELLQEKNDPQAIKKEHEMYMKLSLLGNGEDYVGIDWTRWWYQRNLIIYHNLAKLTEEGDRTLLIVGGAHLHLVSQFLRENGDFEVVSALDYLK